MIPLLTSRRLYVLDGATSSCDWTVEAASAVPGLMPAAAMPSTIRRDFVANSNDSYWLANDGAPLTGFSPIIGLTGEAQNLRTRMGLITIHDQLTARRPGAGPAITPAAVRSMLFSDRTYAAETSLDDILAVCADTPRAAAGGGEVVDLAPACAILKTWDRRMNVDSVGAAIFVEVWRLVSRDDAAFARPFDPADPVHTPAGLKRDVAGSKAIVKALADAMVLLGQRHTPLDAPWGQVQVAVRGTERIPLHGGPGSEDGVLNAQQSRWVDGVGYVPFHGSSYIQVVTFDAAGPVAQGVLTYSQSTDPASPHYADQTWLYSRKQWNVLPFHPADIAAQRISVEHVEE